MVNENQNSYSYKSYVLVVIVLISLLFIVSGITSNTKSVYSVAGGIAFSGISTYFIFTRFMHIKLNKSFLKIVTELVFIIIGIGIVLTFLDYILRP